MDNLPKHPIPQPRRPQEYRFDGWACGHGGCTPLYRKIRRKPRIAPKPLKRHRQAAEPEDPEPREENRWS